MHVCMYSRVYVCRCVCECKIYLCMYAYHYKYIYLYKDMHGKVSYCIIYPLCLKESHYNLTDPSNHPPCCHPSIHPPTRVLTHFTSCLFSSLYMSCSFLCHVFTLNTSIIATHARARTYRVFLHIALTEVF